MSGSVNKMILVGNVGAQPEPLGENGCKFPVATTERWTDRDGNKQERTEWTDIVVNGRTAENCLQYLEKGRQVYIEGSKRTRSWEDQEGNKRYAVNCQAFTVQFLGSGGGKSEGRPNKAQGRGVPKRGWK